MATTLKIFLGSSTEALQKARWIGRLLAKHDEISEVLPWWDRTAFPSGQTFMEALVALLGRTNAALLLATPDDRTNKRGQETKVPRDNIILEYGMWAGRHDRKCVGLVAIGDPGLPTDLLGMTNVLLSDAATEREFARLNSKKILDWVASAHAHRQGDDAGLVDRQLPKVYERLLSVVRIAAETRSPWVEDFDNLAADLLDATARSLQGEGHGITEQLIAEMAQRDLPGCTSISATDVLGPSEWVKPTAYRYLATQSRYYLRGNATAEGWHLSVDPELAGAIERACRRACEPGRGPGARLHESRSLFDNKGELSWSEGTPRLQFSRILLWTRNEICSSIAQSIIAIHEALHIPLMCKIVERDDPLRQRDFILFEGMTHHSGYANERAGQGFELQTLLDGKMPNGERCRAIYSRLLADPDLLMASDARYLYLGDVGRTSTTRHTSGAPVDALSPVK